MKYRRLTVLFNMTDPVSLMVFLVDKSKQRVELRLVKDSGISFSRNRLTHRERIFLTERNGDY
jgi:hypothetical protein